MLSCKKAAQLIDKKSIAHLSMIERWQLSFHLRMCEVCSAYEKQSKVIDSATQKFHRINPEPKHLSESAKAKIIKRLKEE